MRKFQFLTAMLASVPLMAAAQFPFDTLWRPEGDTVATWQGESITDADLTIWLMMKEESPSWLEDWENNTFERTYSNRLKNTTRQFIEMRMTADLAEQAGLETVTEPAKAGRVLSSLPITVSFVDLIAAYEVEIMEYDISLYWRQNPVEYDKRKGDGDRSDYIRDDIFLELYPDHLLQQFQIAVGQSVGERYPIDRGEYLPLLEPEVEILKLGDFTMTQQEFFDLYPDGSEFSYRIRNVPGFITSRVDQILAGEAMIDELDEQGLLAQSWLGESVAIGTDHYLSTKWLAQPFDETPSDVDIQRVIDENREQLAPSTSYVLWTVEAPSESQLAPLVTRASQLLDERADVAGDGAYALPELVLNRLTDSDSPVTFSNLGALTTANIADVFGLNRGDLEIGSFSDIRQIPGGGVQALYVAETRALQLPSNEVLRQRAVEKIREDFLISDVKSSIRSGERDGTLTWNF